MHTLLESLRLEPRGQRQAKASKMRKLRLTAKRHLVQEKAAEVNGPSTAPVEESDPFAMFPKPEDNFQVSCSCTLAFQWVVVRAFGSPLCRRQKLQTLSPGSKK